MKHTDNTENLTRNLKIGWRFRMGGAPGDASWFSAADARMARARRCVAFKVR